MTITTIQFINRNRALLLHNESAAPLTICVICLPRSRFLTRQWKPWAKNHLLYVICMLLLFFFGRIIFSLKVTKAKDKNQS